MAGEQASSGTPGPARDFITPLGQLTLGWFCPHFANFMEKKKERRKSRKEGGNVIRSCVWLYYLYVLAKLSVTGPVVTFFCTNIAALPLATVLNICLSLNGNKSRAKADFLWHNSLQPESWFNLLPINASFSSQPRVSRKRQTGVIKHLVVSPRSRWASLAAQGRGNSRGAMCASRRCQGATHHPELTDKGQIMRHTNSCVCTSYSFWGKNSGKWSEAGGTEQKHPLC